MPLYHFSDDRDIARFVPRPVRLPSLRPAGRDWLNGPLVWAVDDAHQPLYLFPRECPRILVWPTARTTDEDRRRWWGDRRHRMAAFIEPGWFERLTAGFLYRYRLPDETFEELEDAGAWVSRSAVEPEGVERLDDLLAELSRRNVELTVVDSLSALRPLWGTSLHASGLRLRNAKSW